VTGEEEDTRSVRSSHRKVRGSEAGSPDRSEAGSHAGSRREMGMVLYGKKKKTTPPSDWRR